MRQPFDPRVKATFDTLSIFDWADLMRRGLEVLMTSARLGSANLDYTGFGLAKLYVSRKPPVEGLLDVYERLGPGEAQANMRAGVCEVLAQLREPPAAETKLIFPELLKIAGAIRATDALGVLERRFAAVDAWRLAAPTYHAALQFAYKVETHRLAAQLLRTIIGPANSRSAPDSNFEIAQVRPALRAMISSDPAGLLRHLDFFDPEVSGAPYDVQQAIASEVFSLRDRTLSEELWNIAAAQFPTWFALALEGANHDTAQMVRASVTAIFADFHGHGAQQPLPAEHAAIAGKRLQRALRTAADISQAALVYALDQIQRETNGLPLFEWARVALEPHTKAIDEYLHEAIQPLLRFQSLELFMLRRVHGIDGPRAVPRLPQEGNQNLKEFLNASGSDHGKKKDASS